MAEVLTPDLPIVPSEALELIHRICDDQRPDLIVANSCGSFYAQILVPIVGVPALLGNPYLKMSEFLIQRLGAHQFKSPRRDGHQDFVIDDGLVEQFALIEKHQFDFVSPYWHDKAWGLFGDKDPIAHFRPLFEQYYSNVYIFPGAHTPTADEVRDYYVPLARKMLEEVPRPTERHFRHFKGGLYRLEHSAFNSESLDRMVVYQALYGDRAYWVHPESMFFEHVTRDGQTFPRFLEIDKPDSHASA